MCASDYVIYHEYLGPYLESRTFKSNLERVYADISVFYKEFDKYAAKANKDKVSDNEVENEKNNRNNSMETEINDLNNKYDNQINNAENNKDKEEADKLKEEKSKFVEEAKNKYKKTDEEIRNELISRKDREYNEIKTRLTENDIKYYIINNKNGETYANLSTVSNIDDYIKNNALYSIKFPQNINDHSTFQWINRTMSDAGWTGYFIVPKGNGTIQSEVYFYETRNDLVKKEIGIGLVSLLGGILLLLISSISIGKADKLNESKRGLYSSIPLDIRIAIFGGVIFIIAVAFISLNLDLGDEMPFYYKLISEKNIFSILLSTFGIFFIIENITGTIRLLRNKEELIFQCKKSVIYRICKNTFGKFFNLLIKNSSGRTLVLRGTIIMILSILFAYCIDVLFIGQNYGSFYRNIATIYALVYLILIPAYLIKKVSYFNKILIGTEAMVAGNLDYEIKEEGHHELRKLAHNINNIESGFKKSVEQQMKSERLKSELITNVSHDLKTPLTSIINYIDLLKNDELSKEEIEGYVGVLDRKSQRLKVLIEDLFEASKAASGTVELNIEKLDVVQLLKQTLGEFDEKIKNSSLIFKFNDPKKSINLNLDGKKTWRVFENLLTNILKYSQSNTRVYIDVIEEAEKVKIVMKNISAYEMDFDALEIFERFKRGDQSRHTEGSGLGLAIAKSITELQGGKLNIEIDGDLFKATVEFNK